MLQNPVEKIEENHEIVNSTEMVVESDHDTDEEIDMFESFRGFVFKNIQQGVELGNRACIQKLLLPNWCRIHDTAHSEFSYAMCKVALNQIHENS